jgi:hypothetical protein
MITETTETTMTLCEFVGIPESVADLKNRWLNILSPELRTEAMLRGVPTLWVDTVLAHFREHCLSQVIGETYESFSESAKDLFHLLIFQMANELAGSELSLDEQIQLDKALSEMRTDG